MKQYRVSLFAADFKKLTLTRVEYSYLTSKGIPSYEIRQHFGTYTKLAIL